MDFLSLGLISPTHEVAGPLHLWALVFVGTPKVIFLQTSYMYLVSDLKGGRRFVFFVVLFFFGLDLFFFYSPQCDSNKLK